MSEKPVPASDWQVPGIRLMLTIPILAGLCWVVWMGYAAGQFRTAPFVGGMLVGVLTPFSIRRLPTDRGGGLADQRSTRRQLVVSVLASMGSIAVVQYVLVPLVPAWLGRALVWGLLGWGVAVVGYTVGDAVIAAGNANGDRREP